MKIAFATGDGEHVDEQFRRASRLVVYDLGPAGPRLDRTCTFPADRELRSEERIRAIDGASIVFVVAIGPSSAARLARRGIRAATAPAGTRIADLLARLAHAEASRTQPA
jgi:predicted Fe-Mo cluster-binding NifX family protein